MAAYAIDFSQNNVNPLADVASLGSILNVVIPLVMLVAGLIFFVMLVSGAFMYLTSGDSADQVKKAQSTFVTAVIGIVIVVSSFLIVKLLSYVFNINTPI